MGGRPIFGGKKKKKKLEIQELACANLFIIILISLSNGKKGTPMNSGTIVMRCEKKRTLIVHNCTCYNFHLQSLAFNLQFDSVLLR